MRKYIALVFMSFMSILIVFAVGYTRVNDTDMVKAIRLSPGTAVIRVNYTGSVEYADSVSAGAEGSGVVQTVFCKNGDRVEEGDAVLSVCETYADLSSNDVLSQLTLGGLDSLGDILSSGGAVKIYTAGRSGIVSGLDLEAGSFFLKGQSLFKVSGNDSYQVQLNVSEKDISKVEPGQPVVIYCKAVTRSLRGSVASVGEAAKQTGSQTGKLTTIKVTVKLDDDSSDLKPGYTADCSIVTTKKQDVLMIPYSALLTDDDGDYVYVPDGTKVSRRSVTTGIEYSNGVEITSGLIEGDIVVYEADVVTSPEKTVVDEIIADRWLS